jgi:signal transduction histidine kinase
VSVDHVLKALPTRRYLLSVWPWRSLAYAATGLPVTGFVSLCGFVAAIPWIALVIELANGQGFDPILVFLGMLTVALTLVIGPLPAIPIGALERQRLGIADSRPISSGHRHPQGAWLRVRYTEAATWKELAYALILAAAGPFAYGGLALFAFLDVLLLASPLIVAVSDEPAMLWVYEAHTVWQALPFGVGGLLGVPVWFYLVGLIGGGHAMLARALLSDPGGAVLREVTQSRARLADAFEAERQRIERDLHDGAQHRLTSLALQLAVARLDVAAGSPAGQALDKAHAQAKELMVVLRDLIHGIRPQALTELGLAGAVRELAGQSVIAVKVVDDIGGGLPERIESTAYFAVSEALANVAKHSRAASAEVRLLGRPGRLVVEVGDDGRGGADPLRGSGLTGLADRVAAVSGRLLLSSPAGGPTLVRVELPWTR